MKFFFLAKKKSGHISVGTSTISKSGTGLQKSLCLPTKCHYTNLNLACGVLQLRVIIGVPVITAWRVLRLRMEERPPIWMVAANILNNPSRTEEKGWSSRWRDLGEVLTTPRRKNVSSYERFTRASDLD
jgi:hypothetical protein